MALSCRRYFICILISVLSMVLIRGNDELRDNPAAATHSKHKDLFPMTWTDGIGTILVTLGLLVAASGGLGGGCIIVPLYILVFDFKPKYAIALSNFTILGSSIMNMILNFPKRHPFKDRPLVDWDLVTIMQPLTMAGALAGAFISVLLPDLVVTLLLMVFLGYTTYTTLQKGISQYQKETVAMEATTSPAENESDATQEKAVLLETDATEADAEHHEALDVELKDILEREKTSPYFKVSLLTLMFVGIIVLNLLKGGYDGYASPLGIQCGSTSYWMMTLLDFAWIGSIFWYLRELLVDEWRVKRHLQYCYEEGDIEWNPVNTLYYPALCTTAGVFAGMLGVGGGLVKGPIMLLMGVHPLVTSATCAVMIFYTSIVGTSSYIAFGLIIWDYAWFFFFIGLVATAAGQFGVSYLVEKYKRVSYVSLSIGAVVAISTCLLTFQSLLSASSSTADSDETTAALCH